MSQPQYSISSDPAWNLCFNLLLDDSISEVESNGPNSFFIKRSGKRIHLSNISFSSDDAYAKSIEFGVKPHIASFLDYDPHGYIYEGPLNYEAGGKLIRGRCHIALPPASDTPQVTIAKKSTALASLDDIAAKGSMAKEMLAFVKGAISADLTTVLSGGTGAGKALTHDTKIPTPSGFTTMGRLRVGDTIFDHHGATGKVIKKFTHPARQVYAVTFSNGEVAHCDLEHNWYVSTPVSRKVNGRFTASKKQRARQPLYKVMTTKELIEAGVSKDGIHPYHVPLLETPLEFNDSLPVDKLPIHPYLLGLWLGDGFSGEAALSAMTADKEFYATELQSLGTNISLYTYPSSPDRHGIKTGIRGEFRNNLRSLGLLERKNERNTNKFIPIQYEKASPEARLMLLQGLIDSDGSVRGCRWLFHNTNDKLLMSFYRIASSLGFKAKLGKGAVCVNTSVSLSRLPRKAEKHQDNVRKASLGKTRETDLMIMSIEKIPGRVEEMSCIMVDTQDSTYLFGESCTTSHNTTFLEAMTKLIPLETRMGVAEDTPELSLIQPNTTYLHSVPWRPGMDEKDVASLSWVVAQFNRMRTDKLIIGETRGKEFSDFLIAANSGMEGSLTTIHANDPVRALDKMTNFALKGAPGTPIRSVNTDIATSVDLIIQLGYFKTDSRYRVLAIQEITPTISTGDDAAITTNRLYTYDPKTDTWIKEGQPTDRLRQRFVDKGVNIEDILRTPPGTVLYSPGRSSEGGSGSYGGLPVRRVI